MNTDQNRQLYRALRSAPDSVEISIQAHAQMGSAYRLVCVTGRAGAPFKSSMEIGLLHDSSGRVAYYQPVWVSRQDALVRDAALSLVWRSSDYLHEAALRHLTLNVQFNYLLAQYDLIVSDGNLRAGGPFFWEAQISAALAKGLFVFVQDSQNPQPLRIPDMASFDILKNRIWDKSDELGGQVALIRRDALQEDQGYRFPLALTTNLDGLDPAKLAQPS